MNEEELSKYQYDPLYGYVEKLKNNKHGFMDTKTGEIIIPVKYENSFGFFDGLAVVKLDGKWGIIDEKDNVILKIKYDKIKSFENGIFAIKLKEKYGFYNIHKRKIIMPMKYDYIEQFLDLICVGLEKKFGFFNNKLIQVVPFIYDYVDIDNYEVNNNIICVGQNKKLGFIDGETGKIVIPIICDNILKSDIRFVKVVINGKIVCYENKDNEWNINNTSPIKSCPI